MTSGVLLSALYSTLQLLLATAENLPNTLIYFLNFLGKINFIFLLEIKKQILFSYPYLGKISVDLYFTEEVIYIILDTGAKHCC